MILLYFQVRGDDSPKKIKSLVIADLSKLLQPSQLYWRGLQVSRLAVHHHIRDHLLAANHSAVQIADKCVIIWTSKLEGILKYSHNDAVQAQPSTFSLLETGRISVNSKIRFPAKF